MEEYSDEKVVSQAVSQQLFEFVRPLLNDLDVALDRRLVRTFLGSVSNSVEIAVADFPEVESTFEHACADVARENASYSALEFSVYTVQIVPFASGSKFPPKSATLPLLAPG